MKDVPFGVFEGRLIEASYYWRTDQVQLRFSTAHGDVCSCYAASSPALIEAIKSLFPREYIPAESITQVEDSLSILRSKLGRSFLLSHFDGEERGGLVVAVPFDWQANAIDISRDRAGRWFYE